MQTCLALNLISSSFCFSAGIMVPLLFLVATTTTSNSTTNGNHSQGKNNKSDAPRHVRLSNAQPLKVATNFHCCLLQSSLSLKNMIITHLRQHIHLLDYCLFCSLVTWTVIYSLLCIFIYRANSRLWDCDCWLSPRSQSLVFSKTYTTEWNELMLIPADKMLLNSVTKSHTE